VNRAKQMVPTSYEGHVIGDGILFHLEQGRAAVRRPRADGELAAVPCRDRRLQGRLHPRRPLALASARQGRHAPHYRFQVQGPNAKQILDKINGGPIPT
jgi:vanillate/3-O-methylgallate O-demethylase